VYPRGLPPTQMPRVRYQLRWCRFVVVHRAGVDYSDINLLIPTISVLIARPITDGGNLMIIGTEPQAQKSSRRGLSSWAPQALCPWQKAQDKPLLVAPRKG
ncbi:hypothetical protein HAX54_020564, partial [Datura stramonium]|nr:hypothetical protein [Datura stramonium]